MGLGKRAKERALVTRAPLKGCRSIYGRAGVGREDDRERFPLLDRPLNRPDMQVIFVVFQPSGPLRGEVEPPVPVMGPLAPSPVRPQMERDGAVIRRHGEPSVLSRDAHLPPV